MRRCSIDQTPVADQGCRDADEGEEVLSLSLVAAMESTAARRPGHRPLYDPTVPAEMV